jgi:hypothetical protein
MSDPTKVSRRRFLQTGAIVTGGAAAGLTSIAALARPAVRRPRALKAFPALKGRLILPDQEGFAMAAWPNNARWGGARMQPLRIAMCADDEDVRRCIKWARDEGATFLIRSGGHNYAGFSTTAFSGSPDPPIDLLIDVKAMSLPGVDSRVELDLRNMRATVAGGASNQDVATALRAIPGPKRYAVPSGRCPTVGTSGLVLGGGWGFSATKFGLTCDSLVATDIVLANGNQALINDYYLNPYSDLFWAVRGGGGGNFGVHTSFTFKLHEVPDVVTTFNLVWPPGQQVELMTALQNLQKNNAQTISTRSKVRPLLPGPKPGRDQLVVETLGLYWGNEAVLTDILSAAGLFKPEPVVKDIYQMDYWRARDYLLTDDPVGMYQIKSSYVENALSPTALDKMLTWMTQWPGGSLRQDNMGILFAIGGKVREVSAGGTAYAHRNSNYIYEMEASWGPIDNPDVVKAQRDWLAAYYADMQQFVQPESYVNFPDRDLKDWARAYYGCNLARLSEVKNRYDPGNFFRFAQSIPLKLDNPPGRCP